MSEGRALIEARDLVKHFRLKSDTLGKGADVVRAVNGVSLSIRKGETMGLVGESGCGKSTVGRLLIRLLDPTAGSILYRGEDIAAHKGRRLRDLRKDMQIIFQDPYSSLNPRMSCESIIGEPLSIHARLSRAEKKEKVRQLMYQVGLPKEYANRYPHEFSGGQRQRIGIARALAVGPEFVVCDEPVSALDVSVQSQVLNLLRELQGRLSLTYLFIAHGLNVVKYISDRICVMYLGSVVELAHSEDLHASPLHPYTKALISAVPDTDVTAERRRIILEGDVPSPTRLPEGCPFHSRCPHCEERCRQEIPRLAERAPGHFAACHLYG
ncbi:MAG: ATP-binding cassette domain-containing protein [Clostridiales bacterium]|jgi:oligopeptide/dipeptide ABC transporter ATP-binding protein|nr:ATP-binding cassette domain-containing protein [Clostridiales bacterium]